MGRPLSVAILDLNNGTPNQGIFCIERILEDVSQRLANEYQIGLNWERFGVRDQCAVPKLDDFDVLIGSGGPGSPFEGIGLTWESRLFKLWSDLYDYNAKGPASKKFLFGICHSYELLIRLFNLGDIVPIS